MGRGEFVVPVEVVPVVCEESCIGWSLGISGLSSRPGCSDGSVIGVSVVCRKCTAEHLCPREMDRPVLETVLGDRGAGRRRHALCGGGGHPRSFRQGRRGVPARTGRVGPGPQPIENASRWPAASGRRRPAHWRRSASIGSVRAGRGGAAQRSARARPRPRRPRHRVSSRRAGGCHAPSARRPASGIRPPAQR